MLYGFELNPVITIGTRRRASGSGFRSPQQSQSSQLNMVSSNSELDEGRNPYYAQRNQGPMSLPVGPGYGALFSPPPGTRFGGQNLTPNAQTREPYRDGFEEEGTYLHLGLQTQTSAQRAGQARRRSKRRGKQPVVEQEAPPTQVVVTEAYLQSLLAQITAQGGVPPA